MLELNDVLIKGEAHTLSLMARERQITCLVGGSRWLYAMMGFEPVVAGFISIDGEPMTPKTAQAMRRQMAFAPRCLDDVGEFVRYEAPTADDVFALRANRQCDDDALEEETVQTGGTGQQARLLAVAVLLKRPILLVEEPNAVLLPYLRKQALSGRIVIISSTDDIVINAADNVVDCNSLNS